MEVRINVGFEDEIGDRALGRLWLLYPRAGFRISLLTGTNEGLHEGISGEGARKLDWGVADTVEYWSEPTLGEDAGRYGAMKLFTAGIFCM